VRHRGQINEVEITLPWPRLPAAFELELRKLFTTRYEQLYGRGSALAGAQLELAVCRLRARALTPQPRLVASRRMTGSIPKAAVRRKRDIYWPDLGKRRATPVFDGEALAPGNRIAGPAIVETADTTVVVQPGTRLRVDELGNFEMSF
jgi:N-methylhydantoinase A